MIQGYTCSKTKQIVECTSQMLLESLPPILILHLKLFDYDIETGAGRKLMKRIEICEHFDIPKECVSGKSKSCRRYKILGGKSGIGILKFATLKYCLFVV